MMQGKFICFFGLDASGKTTQAKLLQEYLNNHGYASKMVHGFKNGRHSGTLKKEAVLLGGEFYHHYTPEMRSLSYICDIMETYVDIISPLLDAGTLVISDKYKVESCIYPSLLDCRKEIMHNFIDVIPDPDINIYLSVDPYIAHERLVERAKILEERKSRKDGIEYMLKSKLLFDEFCENHSNSVRIDANGDRYSIHEEVIACLYEHNIL